MKPQTPRDAKEEARAGLDGDFLKPWNGNDPQHSKCHLRSLLLNVLIVYRSASKEPDHTHSPRAEPGRGCGAGETRTESIHIDPNGDKD